VLHPPVATDAVHSTHSDESSAEGERTSPDASASKEPPQAGDDRKRQCARLDELDEAQRALEEEQGRLHHTLSVQAATTPVHKRSQEVRTALMTTFTGLLLPNGPPRTSLQWLYSSGPALSR
jgi:hypothetical protein